MRCRTPLVEQAPSAVGAEASILEVDAAMAVRRESSPKSSKLSTGNMNPESPGWDKRVDHWMDHYFSSQNVSVLAVIKTVY